jgi:hypothetical protein
MAKKSDSEKSEKEDNDTLKRKDRKDFSSSENFSESKIYNLEELDLMIMDNPRRWRSKEEIILTKFLELIRR